MANEREGQFERWVAEHGTLLHHVANGFAEGADRHDLMQELLLALWRAVPAFRNEARPSTFIYRVAHNAALTWHRTQKSYRRRIDHFEALAVPPQPEAAAREVPERQALEMLYRAIRDLPAVDRSLVLLHLDGVSYAEMAAMHGLSETNVGARLTRARQRLAEVMKGVLHELR
jgi:RNA polymerase sigma factor (sigma-70 family)